MIRISHGLALLLLAAPATAQDAARYASEGTIFEVQQNANGAVLTSRYPKAIYTNAGAASRWDIRPVTLYLGASCDAFSPDYGDGSWEWANGGFLIEFEGGKRFGFPRQEHPVEAAGIGCSD